MAPRFCVILLFGALFGVMPDRINTGTTPITVSDVVSMTRIQGQQYDQQDVAAFAPSGRRFAVVVYRGSLDRDANIYSILLFHLGIDGAWRLSGTVFTVNFKPADLHPNIDQYATPVSALRFLNDHTIVFVGILSQKTAQVYSVDVDNLHLRQLTDSPTAVKNFAITPAGRITILSLSSYSNRSPSAKELQQGFPVLQEAEHQNTFPLFDLWSTEMIGADPELAFYARSHVEIRLVEKLGSSVLVFDTSQNKAKNMSVDHGASGNTEFSPAPSGEAAIFTEYEPGNAVNAQTYVLIDVGTRSMRPLLANTPVASETSMLWTDDSDVMVRSGAADQQYTSVNIRSNHSTVLPITKDWTAESWDSSTSSLLLRCVRRAGPCRSDRTLAIVRKTKSGSWTALTTFGPGMGLLLDPTYRPELHGRYIVGIRDGLSTPPEVAVYDLRSHRTTVLTDLNPLLRRRSFGEVSRVYWDDAYGRGDNFGYLIKPVGYVQGHHYPAVILLKDSSFEDTDNSFLIDGQEQLSGFAAQVLANDGFVVLLTPDSRSMQGDPASRHTLVHLEAHVESAVDYLNSLGLIDRSRVGISGWSFAAFYTDWLIAHSKAHFSAASDIDGGAYYQLISGYVQPFQSDLGPDRDVDLHVRDIHTPLLSEAHELATVLLQSRYISKLVDLHKPVDFYFYPNDTHNLRMPWHRYYSLTRNVDWFRFWLQGYEDPNPAKAAQYRHWEALRKLQEWNP